jgi:hypothetical protein
MIYFCVQEINKNIKVIYRVLRNVLGMHVNSIGVSGFKSMLRDPPVLEQENISIPPDTNRTVTRKGVVVRPRVLRRRRNGREKYMAIIDWSSHPALWNVVG